MFAAVIVVVVTLAPCFVFLSIPLTQLQLRKANFARKIESKSTTSDHFCSLAAEVRVRAISPAYGFDLRAKKSGSPTWGSGGVGSWEKSREYISARLVSARSNCPRGHITRTCLTLAAGKQEASTMKEHKWDPPLLSRPRGSQSKTEALCEIRRLIRDHLLCGWSFHIHELS